MKNRRMKGILTALMMALVLVFAAPDVSAAGDTTLTIIHTNDVHGNAVGDEPVDDEGKPNDSAKYIGYARYKTFIDQMIAERGKENVLVFDAGDVLHGTTFATLTRGEAMVHLMDTVSVAAMVPGNHDFNYGYSRLKELESKAEFDILAYNVVMKDTGEHAFESDQLMIREVDGVVGVFGLATEETVTKSNPLNTKELTFNDPIASAKEAVAALKAKNVDVILCLSHLGQDAESDPTAIRVAEEVSGIDVIIDGHSHTLLPTGKTVGNTLLAQTGEHLKNIGVVTLKIADKKVTEKTATLVPYKEAAKLIPDAGVWGIIEKTQKQIEPQLAEVIGKTKTDLDGERGNVRTKETNLGNLITDAMLEISKADVALTNGGGIRASIPAGDVTMGAVLKAFPFTNYPVVLELTGEDLLKALSFGVNAYPESAGKFPQVAGVKIQIAFDEKGQAYATDVVVGDAPLDLAKTYTLVTNDFLAVGGDGYDVFQGKKIVAEYPLLSEVLADYFKARPEGVDAEVEGRITVEILSRIFGKSRFDTAVALSEEFAEECDTVILTTGRKYMDALSASRLADVLEAPILLCEANRVPDNVMEQIKSLGAKKAVILGGKLAVNESVEAQVKAAGLTVERISGTSRYDTSLAIGKETAKKAESKTVVLAYGEHFADALSVAGVAKTQKALAVLLVNKELNPATIDALKEWKVEKAIIAGGTMAVGSKVDAQLAEMGIAVERVSGKNRYETSAKLAKLAYPDAQDVFMASGENFADALAAAPLAARAAKPMVLTSVGFVNPDTKAYVVDNGIRSAILVGGELAVNHPAALEIVRLLAK